jgi:outer membrane protein, multidrug efflux system
MASRCPRLLSATVSLALALPIVAMAAPATTPASQATSKPATAAPKKDSTPRYNLRQLLEMARTNYPGIRASRLALASMEQQLLKAKWGQWIPQAQVRGLVAPTPEISCSGGADNCIRTNVTAANVGDALHFRGIMGKIDLEIGLPLYTFGKLSAAQRAATAGVTIRGEEVKVAQDRLVVDVTRGYWGLKLAREILYTIRDGQTYLVDAEKTIQKDIDSGEGEYTLTDLLRLQASRAEIDIRIAEGQKFEALALDGLATLVGKQGKPFDVDTSIIDVLRHQPRPLDVYLQAARSQRPEVRMLEEAVKARGAAVDLERARFFPDFLFVAMLGVARTSSVDIPNNVFFNNSFNYTSAGIGLAMNWKWDQYVQYRQFKSAKLELEEVKARREEATAGMGMEVRRSWHDLREAMARLDAAAKGEKISHKWLVTVSQNLAAGLAESRDLIDSLLSFFQIRVRHLWAMYDVNIAWSELGRVVGGVAAKK